MLSKWAAGVKLTPSLMDSEARFIIGVSHILPVLHLVLMILNIAECVAQKL